MSDPSVLRVPFELENSFGDPITGDIRMLENLGQCPVIVICHSFMAFKDWGFFPHVASTFAKAGYVAVSFNFSLGGVVGHGSRITDFERFRRNTFSREFSDLNNVLDAIVNGTIAPGSMNPRQIALFGHSRGGGIAIVKTATDTRVKALITWSAISTFDRWTNHQKEKWRSTGLLPLARNSTVSPLQLGVNLLEDFEQHREEYDILKAAGKIHCPWLIVHGGADVTVPPREAEKLYAASNSTSSELRIIEHAGHLYSAASPSEDNYHTLTNVLDQTTTWLRRHFS